MLGNENRLFDAATFLAKAGPGRTLVQYSKKQFVCMQGDSATAIFYIQRGRIKLTALSAQGKEAAITLLGTGDFIGESCFAPHCLEHTASALAITECWLLRIEKNTMLQVLHNEPAFLDLFISYLVTRNNRVQDALVDQLFNSVEKRLARILLSLGRFGKEEDSAIHLQGINQETLAEMVGTSRSRVNIFMNRFKKLGMVEYDRDLELKVNSSLLSRLLHE